MTLGGFPSRWSIVTKKDLDLLDSLLAGLGVGEIELDCASQAKCSKDDEQSPTDVLKSWRDKPNTGSVLLLHRVIHWNLQSDGKIEQPISYRGDAHACRSCFKGPDFGGVDPADGCKGERVDDDQ